MVLVISVLVPSLFSLLVNAQQMPMWQRGGVSFTAILFHEAASGKLFQ
jgi:hypothetical protein